jgi:adenosylhomocysteinase
MDGFWVMPMNEAAELGDIFVTTTGNISVIREEHFLRMKDGAILCNAGHFNVEIDIEALNKLAEGRRRAKEDVEEYSVKGKRLYLLAEGRLVNLACAEGHPAAVMDMSFANQALCIRYIKENKENLQKRVYFVPEQIDREVARLKLSSMGIKIDTLLPEQERYMKEWKMGT